jgi:hypothetical protein
VQDELLTMILNFRARDALWASFQASVSETGTQKSKPDTPSEEKMIKVQKRYRFAGEEVTWVIAGFYGGYPLTYLPTGK